MEEQRHESKESRGKSKEQRGESKEQRLASKGTAGTATSSRSEMMRRQMSEITTHSLQSGASFTMHWFGARRFEHDPLLEVAEREACESSSTKDMLRNLAKEEFKRKKRGGVQGKAPQTSRSPASPPGTSSGALGTIAEVAEAAGEAAENIDGFMMNATCSGVMEEDLVRQHRPLFTGSQLLVCLLLYIIFRLAKGTKIAGFESIIPGETSFMLHQDCTDRRAELWRYLTYQFTHTSFQHIFLNTFLLFFAGLPLEGFHGTCRIALVFNVGVFGGAVFHGTFAAHAKSLAGMSAGCYAMLAMHWADLGLNWRQCRFRRGKITLLVCMTVVDVLVTINMPSGHHEDEHTAVSLASHLGGFATGLLVGILVGRNLKVNGFERVAQAVSVFLLVLMAALFSAWLAQWPPRTLFEGTSWCWARQAINITTFGDLQWHCLRCGDEACIQRWSQQEAASLRPVSHNRCSQGGYWWN